MDLDAVADFFQIQAIYFVVFLLACFLAALFAVALVPGNTDPWQRLMFLVTLGKRGAWRPLDLHTANTGGKPDERAQKLLKAIGEVADPKVRAKMLISHEEGRRRIEQAQSLFRKMDQSTVTLERDASRVVRLITCLVAITFPILALGSAIPLVVGALTGQTFSFGRIAGMVSIEKQPGLFWLSMVSSALLSGICGLAALHAIRARRSTPLRPDPTMESDARSSGARGPS